MRQKKFSLREQKAGDKRIEILDAFVRELETKMIHAISVDRICEMAKISKVTFFKYFESKEQVLYFFIHKWQYALSCDIETMNLSGSAGIYHVFESVAAEPYSMNILLAIIQYFIKLEAPPEPMVISDYEYYLFHGEAYRLNVPKRDLRDIFAHYLNSMNCKEIDATLENLVSVFYGVPVAVHMMGAESALSEKYRSAVHAALQPTDLPGAVDI